ncbi:MAG: hypothetical protein WCE75_01120, partial [Terracidiphilus sp.]
VAAWLRRKTPSGGRPEWLERFEAARPASAPSASALRLLDLPGGVSFFRGYGLLQEVAETALRLSSVKGAERCAGNLRVLFSPDDLGKALILVESRNAPAEALALLDHVNRRVRYLPEFSYLRALALSRQGDHLSGHGDFSGAIDHWKQACELAKAECPDPAFRPLLTATGVAAQEALIAATQREAKRLKAAANPDAAIALLEKALPMDKDEALVEYLCLHLCDRGSAKLGKKEFVSARRDYLRVLELKANYERAKQGVSTTYNNEGCEETDNAKSIALFENALKWNPGNTMAKRNLASELRSKAIDRVNAATGYALRGAVDDAILLLERAYNLLPAELKQGALEIIKNAAEVDAEVAKAISGKVDDEMLKKVIGDLATVYNMRARIRRGY